MYTKEEVLKMNGINISDISFMSEYGEYYYVRPSDSKLTDFYDDTIWKISKKTGEKEYYSYPNYIYEDLPVNMLISNL